MVEVGSFLGGHVPYEFLYDNPDGHRAIAPDIDRIRENIPWLAEQDSWIVWEWSKEGQKIPHRGADPDERTGWQEQGAQASLEEAWEAYREHDHLDGIGFVFNGTEPEILEDFDDCINPWGKVKGAIQRDCLEDALENDDEPAFYSTSGTGAHRYPVAADAEDTTQHPHEVYIGDGNNNRWAAITGFKIKSGEHGPDRSERVNELSEEYNESGAKTVDLSGFDFDADPAEIDADAPLPEAIVDAYGGDVPRCVAGLVHVLGTHDPTDEDGPGWGQQTFMRYSHLLMLLADHHDADAEQLIELVASFKAPAITATQRGEHPKKDAKPTPFGEGVPWDLKYQARQIARKVENDDLSPPKVETIEDHCNLKIDSCDCETHLRTWQDVKGLLEADVPGTTTKAYNLAADLINAQYHIRTIRTTGHVYFYDESLGYYVLKGNTYIHEIINRNLGEHANISRRREITEKVVAENYVDREDFQPEPGKVCVENGVLDLETLELEEWSPEYYFTSRLQVEWPEDGEPHPWAEAWWLRALHESAGDPAEVEKILRWIGYAFESWHHDLEQNLFFVGYRRSGKSTIQEAIEELFGGPPTAVNLTPQQLADTQFDAGRLREAAINTVNDINATRIKNSGMLKRVFSGESLKLEDKHKDPEFGAPNAKHLFTANWLPRVDGSDEALFRRILIVEFVNKVSKEDRDPKFKKRLKRKDVQQAILVTAARARKRLREENGRFPADREASKTRKIWDSWQNPHKRFLYLQFHITADPDHEVEKKTYWKSAHEFATVNGWEPKSPRAMSKDLSYTPGIYTNGESDHYGGLRWREVNAAELEAPTFAEQNGAPDDTERYQSQLELTQNQKYSLVKRAVNQVAAENADGAPREAVIKAADDKGVDESDAEHIIQNMLKDGRLFAPDADDRLQVVE